VSGVGHEIDYTIADFVADARAPTPSVAAEMVSMDQYETMMTIDGLTAQLIRRQLGLMQIHRQKLDALNKRLLAFHPKRQLDNLQQRLRFAQTLLVREHNQQINLLNEAFKRKQIRLLGQNPRLRIQNQTTVLSHRISQLESSARQNLKNRAQALALHSRSLDNLSPLKTLSRGFAAVTREDQLIHSVDQLKPNDSISLRFQDGKIGARVEYAERPESG
jgi:exodeoxyribonuclease VII large subunit